MNMQYKEHLLSNLYPVPETVTMQIRILVKRRLYIEASNKTILQRVRQGSLDNDRLRGRQS